MRRRRAMIQLRWAAVLCLLGATLLSAQEPTSTPNSSPLESMAPAASVGPETLTANPSVSPKVLYPSTSPSSLVGRLPANNTAIGASSLGTTFLVLLVFCGVGYYLLQRHPSFAAKVGGATRKLVVSESRSLGNRQFLVVVEYENERMLLGVTPGKIDYLCPLRGSQGEPGTFPPLREVGT